MVETRHHAAQLALAAQTIGTESSTPAMAPDWQTVTDKLQEKVDRLEVTINTRFQDMQTTMLANLHKMMEIALGKKINAGEMLAQHKGVLGSPQSSSRNPEVLLNPTTVVNRPIHVHLVVTFVEVEDNEMQAHDDSSTHNFVYKLLCPKFDGLDFKSWYYKIEQYFEVERVPDATKVRVVMLHLEGKALQWHQFVTKTMRDLGSSFWGMVLILASTNLLTARIAAGCFLVVLLVVLCIAKNWTLRGLCIGFVVFLGAVWALQETTKIRILRYVILFIGVMNSLFSVYDIYDDLISRRVHSSDAEKFAEVCPCPCNGVGWGVIWGFISLVFLCGAMYIGLVILS